MYVADYSVWMAEGRRAWSARAVLLLCRFRERLRSRRSRGALPRMSLREHSYLRHQWRGHARPVGVPGDHRATRHSMHVKSAMHAMLVTTSNGSIGVELLIRRTPLRLHHF